MDKEWRARAARYYRDGVRISAVAELVGVSRQSVSAYLKTLPDYQKQKQARGERAALARRAYKTGKQREYRAADRYLQVTGETMRREHDLAALELSREIYH